MYIQLINQLIRQCIDTYSPYRKKKNISDRAERNFEQSLLRFSSQLLQLISSLLLALDDGLD